MQYDSLIADQVAHRNFNLCPHCLHHGQQGFLTRLCESMPMISRSDGNTFHLLLADRPLPYPQERNAAASDAISVCFWYSHVDTGSTTHAVVVILPETRLGHPVLFRVIDSVADLLAYILLRTKRLSSFYQFSGDSLQPLAH